MGKEVTMNPFVDRMVRAAKLDIHLYEEVEADKTALFQSMIVVVLSSVAASIDVVGDRGIFGFFIGAIAALIGWLIWSYLTYIIGTKILPTQETRATYGELLRTIGFSSSPGLIRILEIIPGLAQVVSIVAQIWMLVAMIIAVRQALDYTSTFRAVGVCVIGWIIQYIVLIMSFGLFA
jgi:hypothetical protein